MASAPPRSDVPGSWSVDDQRGASAQMQTSERVHIRWLILSLMAPGFVIGLFAGLIPLGKWQLDEYGMLTELRIGGLDALFQRIVTWSFRPFSETLIYGYARSVETSGGQLMTRTLVLLWIGLVCSATFPAFWQWRRYGSTRGLTLLLLTLTITSVCLNSHEVGEFFYWPQGSLAYVPTLAAISFVSLWISFNTGPSATASVPVAIALVIAAYSAEVGAMFTVMYCGTIMSLYVVESFWKPINQVSAKAIGILAIPLFAGLSVFYFVIVGRLVVTRETVDGAVSHELLPSLYSALLRYPLELLGFAPDANRLWWTVGMLAAKAALFAGAYFLFRQTERAWSRTRSLELLALAVGLLGGGLLSLFAGFYQFGAACCQRHQTMRECLAVLAIVVFARLLSLFTTWRSGDLRRNAPARVFLPAGVLVAASLLATLPNAQRLRSDYANFDSALNARIATWNSGMSFGPAMTFSQPPVLKIVGGQEWPVGLHTRSPDTHWILTVIMNFFGKDKIDMRPAGQG